MRNTRRTARNETFCLADVLRGKLIIIRGGQQDVRCGHRPPRMFWTLADAVGRNENWMKKAMMRVLILSLAGISALGVPSVTSACQRCQPGCTVCPTPVRSSGYNPYGSSYGRMLSYTEALSRAEDANKAEAALAESRETVGQLNAELAALKEQMAQIEQQLAKTQKAREESEKQRQVAVKENAELIQQLQKANAETAEQKQAAEKLQQELAAEQKKSAQEAEGRKKEAEARQKAEQVATARAEELAAEQAKLKTAQDEVAKLKTEIETQQGTIQQQRTRIETLEKAAIKPEEPKVESEEATAANDDTDN